MSDDGLASAAKTQPQVVVRCENVDCEHYMVERTVAMQHIGRDVYTLGGVFCFCRGDAEMRVVSRK